MRRVAAIIVLAVVAIGAATIADYPGSVAIAWQGWEIDTSVGVLVAAVALVALALWLVFSLFAGALRLPRLFRRYRRERRRRLGELALTRGVAALAAGDRSIARRQAERAEMLLGPNPLALMLTAHTALLDGDAAGAHRRYIALLENKDSAFIGLRGLIGEALRAGNDDEALGLAERAYRLRPSADWAFETLFALQTRAAKWEAARDTLTSAMRRKLLPTARAGHHSGALNFELSLEAEQVGDGRRAVSLAATAQEMLPDIAAAAARHARLLIAEGRYKAARRVLEAAWHRAPHPELMALWNALGDAAPALELVAWTEKLATHNPDASETAVARAEAALTAQLWGEARRHLGEAMAASPGVTPRRLCLLMARLEDSEHPGEGRAREWLDRALTAPADAGYVCAQCGGVNHEWRALCAHCHGFDTLAWRPPAGPHAGDVPALVDTVAPAVLLPMPDDLASAGQSAR